MPESTDPDSTASTASSDAPLDAPPGRNRLGSETSPYLRQHAENPVHWLPWGPEAIARARALDRPIFLSVGYATCYWCHVMERESFESVMIAELLNAHFVPVKVDREERPDVDHLFMQAVQLLNHGHGGWPMSVFIEPAGLRPFLAGTYFPVEETGGQPAFGSVLRQVHGFWTSDRERVEQQAGRLADEIGRLVADRPPSRPLDADTVSRAVDQLMNAYDPTHSGFGGGAGRPKFPTPVNLELLMAAGWDRPEVKRAVVRTLDRMAMGGIHDQVGGGFHRYSVDERWEVPHFEKMLFDNAQLLGLYARGFERTCDQLYRSVAEGIIAWVRRSMRLDGGAFASALDAEVDQREGLNYLWTAAEVEAAMTEAGRGDEVARLNTFYGLDRGPNFQDPHHPDEPARHVLWLPVRPSSAAVAAGYGEDAYAEWRREVNDVLLAVRSRRRQPTRDDKVLAGWNGMMIAALADAGRILEDPVAIEDGICAARFVLDHVRTPDGGLARSWCGESSDVPAALEDHAMFAGGLLALHDATGDDQWRVAAARLIDGARSRFRDENGGWWDCDADRADLFVRVRDLHDGAVPSGTAAILAAIRRAGPSRPDSGDDVVRGLRAISAAITTRPGLSPAIAGVLHDVLSTDSDAAAALAAPPASASDPAVDPAVDPAADSAPAGSGADAPLSVTCSHAEVRLGPDRVSRATVVLSIATGLHVAAHDPGVNGLAGLTVRLEDGEGVALEVDHPAGTPHDGPLGPTRVHVDAVAIPIRFRRTGPVAGTPRLVVAVQACSDSACQAPSDLEVPVAFRVE